MNHVVDLLDDEKKETLLEESVLVEVPTKDRDSRPTKARRSWRYVVSSSSKSLKKTGVKEKLVVKAPIVEKPLAEDPVELKIPVNKNICVVPIAHIDPKPKIEKIVEVPDKVWLIPYEYYREGD